MQYSGYALHLAAALTTTNIKGKRDMPSFDIVSEIDMHEVQNAIDQANREVTTRFDFKGTNACFSFKENNITLKAENEFQLDQMLIILKNKMTKRSVDLKHLDIAEPISQFKTAEQIISLQQGISSEIAKKITKQIKSEKQLKVQAAIQGEQVRITGKKRDDLQAAIAMLKEQELDIPLQFTNFRD